MEYAFKINSAIGLVKNLYSVQPCINAHFPVVLPVLDITTLLNLSNLVGEKRHLVSNCISPLVRMSML